MLHGQLFCDVPDTDNPDGVPASPGFVKISLVQPWTCVPIGPCSENEHAEVIAETTLDKDGVFDLDFQTGIHASSELYVYTNNDIGVCGNGYQYTQEPLNSYADRLNIVIDVDSIWH